MSACSDNVIRINDLFFNYNEEVQLWEFGTDEYIFGVGVTKEFALDAARVAISSIGEKIIRLEEIGKGVSE